MALRIITHCYSYLRNIVNNGEELSNRMDYLDLCRINYAYWQNLMDMMKTAMICSTKGPSLAMAAVSGMLIHLPLNGPVMIEVDLSNECVYE